jgi:hypothetical protein
MVVSNSTQTRERGARQRGRKTAAFQLAAFRFCFKERLTRETHLKSLSSVDDSFLPTF